MSTKKLPNNFFEYIFWIQNQIQWNHWIETSGWRHLVLGEYYVEISQLLDKLVEGLSGTLGNRILTIDKDMFLVQEDQNIDELMEEISECIILFRKHFEAYPGILNIIDEIIALNAIIANKLKMT